ncbi:transketolase [Halobacteriota archaeon]
MKVREEDIKRLLEKAYRIRVHVLKMISKAGSGHPGGSLSCVDVITALYFYVMHHDPKNPNWPDRDRFVLSKGHAAPTLYAALAESGYIPLEELENLRRVNSVLQGHPDRNRISGIEMSSGSLGQGLSIANGMAMAGKIDNKNYRVYVLLGDGECDEGLIWEAAMTSAHYNLDNLVAIVDRNGLQIDGPTEKIMSLEPLVEKWHAFGWRVIEVDAYDVKEVLKAFNASKNKRGQPTVIIAHSIKGRGVSFMEWIKDFHGRAPTPTEIEKALNELDSIYKRDVLA